VVAVAVVAAVGGDDVGDVVAAAGHRAVTHRDQRVCLCLALFTHGVFSSVLVTSVAIVPVGWRLALRCLLLLAVLLVVRLPQGIALYVHTHETCRVTGLVQRHHAAVTARLDFLFGLGGCGGGGGGDGGGGVLVAVVVEVLVVAHRRRFVHPAPVPAV
jgi:hypothetical protein